VMPLHELPRGGTVVRTRAGLVQFGAPPETIKDALAVAGEVPRVFVLPGTWFSKARGMTCAELEFPAYYHFFMHGRRLTVVCDETQRRRLHAILRESLFGPERYDLARDFAPEVPVDARPDLAAECEYFRRGGGRPQGLTVDDLVDCRLYDDGGVAALEDGVTIRRVRAGEHAAWLVREGERELCTIEEREPTRPEVDRRARLPQSFQPPRFGVTVLGSSHGFDAGGKTTGFVLWLGKRGVLVDPPADATAILRDAGVPSTQVTSVILTHCHADHDSGVFQKLLEAGRCDLYTTPTILGSFLRKWVAITGQPEERLRRLFVFRPVIIGAPMTIHGAECRFFYSLHSIPTIGFACFTGGKSLVYSSDTMYDPPRIREMADKGVLSPARRDQLLAFPWHHSLVIHEAGVPPIHTPLAPLLALPAPVKKRLRLIHIAESDLPAGQGLELARTGFEHTISLQVAEPEHAAALDALDALAAIDLFRGLPIARCAEFLAVAHRVNIAAGTLVIGEGEPGDRFYIVLDGEAALIKDGALTRTYRRGDFFGETALLTGAPRSADVRARSSLSVLAIDKYDFLALLRDTDLVDALFRLAENRARPSWELMLENPALRALDSAQLTQLQTLLEHATLRPGEAMGGDAWLLDDARVRLRGDDTVDLGRGSLLGDIDGILEGKGGELPVEVTRTGGAYRLPAPALRKFLDENPGLQLVLAGTLFV
jgi:CRP-like cAMP-binding protein/phosphoribosyl 1,2-cyclic phosphodiesterase